MPIYGKCPLESLPSAGDSGLVYGHLFPRESRSESVAQVKVQNELAAIGCECEEFLRLWRAQQFSLGFSLHSCNIAKGRLHCDLPRVGMRAQG